MFLVLGNRGLLGHDPPIYLRSTTATRFPSPAKVHAAMVEPVPPPRITRSNSSGCVFLRTITDELLSMRFMLVILSEQQARKYFSCAQRNLHAIIRLDKISEVGGVYSRSYIVARLRIIKLDVRRRVQKILRKYS